MHPSLTIIIPTYNRVSPLRKCLSSIFSQKVEAARLILLDNCSTVPVAELIAAAEKIPEWLEVQVIRNHRNIGLYGNIMRCMDYADTDYVWIVGDDDFLEEGAVQGVLDTITKHPDLLAYNFSSALYGHRGDRLVSGAEIFSEIPSFSNLLFISATIFNMRKLARTIPYGYEYAYSTGPHLAVLFSAVDEHQSIGYFSKRIVKAQIEDGKARWSIFQHWGNLPILAEVVRQNEDRRALLRQINQTASIPLLLLSHLVAATAWRSSRRAYVHYCYCVKRHYRESRGSIVTGAWLGLGWVILYGRYLSTHVADFTLKRKGLKRIYERSRAFEAKIEVK